MTDFSGYKVGDEIHVYDLMRNISDKTQVERQKNGEIKVEGWEVWFSEQTGLCAGYGAFRLVHAPFTAQFPDKPKRKVKKEGWVWKGNIAQEKVDCGLDIVHVTWEEEE